MSGYRTLVAGRPVEPAHDWEIEWIDPEAGMVRARRGDEVRRLLVEGGGQDWHVTVDGRRVPVTVQTWREQQLAEAESASRAYHGPIAVTATLPGLVVAVAVRAGDEVAEGSPLITIEAMKMQNEVRAPRSGRVIEVSVSSGQAVATGAMLVRLE